MTTSPGEPPFSDDRWIHQKIPEILSDKFPRPCVPIAFEILYHREIPVDNYPSLLSVHSFPDTLVFTRCPEILSIFRESLEPVAL